MRACYKTKRREEFFCLQSDQSTAKKSIQLAASAAAGLTWAGVSLAQTWNLNANGNWGTAANWSPALVPNGIGASASLLNIITAPRTVSLNVPVTLGNLTFGGNFAYTIAGTQHADIRRSGR